MGYRTSSLFPPAQPIHVALYLLSKIQATHYQQRKHHFMPQGFSISHPYRHFSSLTCLKLQNESQLITLKGKKKFNGPFLWMGLNCLKAQYSHFEEAVYFLPLSSKEFLVLTLPTSEWWKAESAWEPPSGFEYGTPRLGIQRLGHCSIGKKAWSLDNLNKHFC